MNLSNGVKLAMTIAVSACLSVVMLIQPASVQAATNKVSLNEYLQRTNELLDDLSVGPDPSYEAAREIFEMPKITQMRYRLGTALCRTFDDATKDGKVTKRELKTIVNAIWRGEKEFVDMATAAGANEHDLSAMMMVNFTAIANGVFMMCPKHTRLVSGRFSEVLFDVYTRYVG
jgi:hypothetical protein